MKYSTIFSLLVYSILFSSCDTVRFGSTHQPLAQYYKFNSDKEIILPADLDTTFIYVSEQELVRPDKQGTVENFTGYNFIKLSRNGKALYGILTDEKPTTSNIYSLKGQYCFYKVVDNELQLEYYDEHLRRFTIAHFKIYPDKILMYKDKLRVWWGGKSKYNISFKKSDIAYTRLLQFPN